MTPTVAQLREIGLFGGLQDPVLEQLTCTLALRELGTGETVFEEGESGREMFVVLEGQIEVLKRSKRSHQARVALLGPGDWFGEMSLLDIMPRSATVRVVAAARLLRISAHDLDGLYRRDVKSYSLLVLNIAREMSRRLRVADEILADLASSMDDYTRTRSAHETPA